MADLEPALGRHSAPEAVLREPAHQLSAKAVNFWRVSSLISLTVLLLLIGAAYSVTQPWPWWGILPAALVILGQTASVIFAPAIRYKVHRWEITPTAVYTRSGWINQEQRIAPLSRVQTVDTHQGALMRLFGLSSVTVTTASAAGPVQIEALDLPVARQVVAELTEITGASEGDAT